MSELISFRECARRLKVGEKTIRDAVGLNKITTVLDENGNKKINFKTAKKQAEEFNIGAKAQYGKEPDQLPKQTKKEKPKENNPVSSENIELNDLSTMATAQKAEKIAKAKLAQLELEERIGNLINKDECYRELFQYGTEMRNSFLSIPDRITDNLISLAHDRNAFHTMLVDSLTEVLSQLSQFEEK